MLPSVANGSMGAHKPLWVINEHCVEFAQFAIRNILHTEAKKMAKNPFLCPKMPIQKT